MTALYIHIPFCRKKCAYCDFVSYAGKEALIDTYVRAICREINSPPCFKEADLPPSLHMKRGGKEGGELPTVYFGGGTPTLLELKHFEQIFKHINSAFRIRHSALEISVEANPGTANKEKLKSLRVLGANRLSIGVQSFNDRHLKTLGRIHDAATAKIFYADAREAGFDNINLDLIFALPEQTLDEWKEDLEIAIDLQPEHLSTYNLQIEEGTPFYSAFRIPHSTLPGEDEELAMYEYAIETLTAAGYKHYEISNFAKPGYECQHNLVYWRNGNYLGIGAGAHSHVNGRRWSNPNCIESYIQNAKRLTPDGTRFATDQRETLFMGLRLLDGLPSEKFAGFEKEVAALTKDGLLEQHNGHYRLTRRGLYLGNLVFEKFV